MRFSPMAVTRLSYLSAIATRVDSLWRFSPDRKRLPGHHPIPQVFDEESVLSYTSNVPLSLLKDACLQGTPDEIVEQLAEWRDHGLSYPVLLNLSTVQPSLRRGLAAGNPFAEGVARYPQVVKSACSASITCQQQV